MLILKIFVYLSWIALVIARINKTKVSTTNSEFIDSLKVWQQCLLAFASCSLLIYTFYLIYLLIFGIGKIQGVLNIALLILCAYGTLRKHKND